MTRITCSDYRREMMLTGLKRRLTRPDLSQEEISQLEEQIRRLEIELGMD